MCIPLGFFANLKSFFCTFVLLIQFGGMSQQVDKRIIARIKDLVRQGTRNANEMLRSINRYVKETLFDGQPLPPPSSRRFFPLAKDISNHMLNEQNRLKFSKIDQENLKLLVNKWREERPSDNFFFEDIPGANRKA